MKLTKTILRQIIREEVNRLREEDSPAAQKAKQQGLEYASFGRWKDPKTGKVVAKTASNGSKLVPYNSDTKDQPSGEYRDGEDDQRNQQTDNGSSQRQSTSDFITKNGGKMPDPKSMAKLTRKDIKRANEIQDLYSRIDALYDTVQQKTGKRPNALGDASADAIRATEFMMQAKVAQKQKKWDLYGKLLAKSRNLQDQAQTTFEEYAAEYEEQPPAKPKHKPISDFIEDNGGRLAVDPKKMAKMTRKDEKKVSYLQDLYSEVDALYDKAEKDGMRSNSLGDATAEIISAAETFMQMKVAERQRKWDTHGRLMSKFNRHVKEAESLKSEWEDSNGN